MGFFSRNKKQDFDFENASVEEFFDWFLEYGPKFGGVPLLRAVEDVHGVTGIVFFQKGCFQVQLFAMPANYIIPEHTHPNVDSFELYLGGQVMFSHDGKWRTPSENMLASDEDGLAPSRLKHIRVKPQDKHGGISGPAGAVFLSIQKWINGRPPSCVSKDYDGIALAEAHEADHGELVHKELTWRDAASEEDTPPPWIKEPAPAAAFYRMPLAVDTKVQYRDS